MPFKTLTGTRFTMSADIMRQTDANGVANIPDADVGTWQNNQDPITGEIVRVWKPAQSAPDNPNTPEYDPTTTTIPCLARGVIVAGIRMAGTTEKFGDTYENIEYVKMWIPAHVELTKRDRLTNITDNKGRIIFRDEEYEKPGDLKATVYNIMGITPLLDGWNNHLENYLILERAEV